jgi:hypothetical protein
MIKKTDNHLSEGSGLIGEYPFSMLVQQIVPVR